MKKNYPNNSVIDPEFKPRSFWTYNPRSCYPYHPLFNHPGSQSIHVGQRPSPWLNSEQAPTWQRALYPKKPCFTFPWGQLISPMFSIQLLCPKLYWSMEDLTDPQSTHIVSFLYSYIRGYYPKLISDKSLNNVIRWYWNNSGSKGRCILKMNWLGRWPPGSLSCLILLWSIFSYSFSLLCPIWNSWVL